MGLAVETCRGPSRPWVTELTSSLCFASGPGGIIGARRGGVVVVEEKEERGDERGRKQGNEDNSYMRGNANT